MVNPYTFTSWRTLKAIPNLFYCITVFRSLGVRSFFNLLKENSMNVCLKSDMGLKKKIACIISGLEDLIVLGPIRDSQSFCTLWRGMGKWIGHAEQYHRVIQRTKGLLKGKRKF